MKVALPLALSCLLLIGGCPPPADQPVVADISISATNGPAPLTVTVDGTSSTSQDGQITAYHWNFAGQAESQEPTATHTFPNPGLYTVTLTVTDSNNLTDTAVVDVRAAGGPVFAVIQSDVDGGSAPLTVDFNGTASHSDDDVVRDYFWLFGDGGTSRLPRPSHTYAQAGTYTVTLRVVTAGGVEDTTDATITVVAASAALDFGPEHIATLPLLSEQTLSTFTFEVWFKSSSGGGRLLSLGDFAFNVTVWPDNSIIRLEKDEEFTEIGVTVLDDQWYRLAIVYHTANGATVYLNGVPISSDDFTGDVTLDSLTLGGTYDGLLSDVRFWSTARTPAEVVAGANTTLTGNETGLLGNWRFDEGSGQTLGNLVGTGLSGTLGTSTAIEGIDPVWVDDSPD